MALGMEMLSDAVERVGRNNRKRRGQSLKVYAKSETRRADQARYSKMQAAARIAKVDPEARAVLREGLNPSGSRAYKTAPRAMPALRGP